MDGQSLRELIIELLKESFLESQDVVMRTKKYHGGKWEETLRLVISDLFKDVGVKRVDAQSKEEGGSIIRIALSNGDVIQGNTIPFPISGTVVISGKKGKMKRDINGPQAINLVPTMKKLWDEYSGGATSE